MRRRDFLSGLCLASVGQLSGIANAMTSDPKQVANAYGREALRRFPLTLTETAGTDALTKWEELKATGVGTPVVLGDASDSGSNFSGLLTPFWPNGPNVPPPPSVDEILTAAARIQWPDDLLKSGQPGVPTPPLGQWPATPDVSPGLAVAYDPVTLKSLPKVYVGIAPTEDSTEIPAYLRWGGWNGNPAAEFHIAALRSWRDQYGAELVGMSFDTVDIRVARRPKTREEALALARVHAIYCPDLFGSDLTLSDLAASLMANDWWFFWWD